MLSEEQIQKLMQLMRYGVHGNGRMDNRGFIILGMRPTLPGVAFKSHSAVFVAQDGVAFLYVHPTLISMGRF